MVVVVVVSGTSWWTRWELGNRFLVCSPNMFPSSQCVPQLVPNTTTITLYHASITMKFLRSWIGIWIVLLFLFWGYTHNTHNNYDNLLYDRYILTTYLCGLFLYPLMGSWDRGIGQGNSLTMSNCHIQDPCMTFSI